jgi:hypothetical protein
MATRMQQRRGTAAQWTSTNAGAGPVLNAGEIGWESDTNRFKIGDGVNNWANLDYFADINSTINPSFGSSITFEGVTADSYETTLQVTDPTEDRTITFPNATGTVVLADGSGNVTVSGDLTVSGTTTTINSTTINATTGIVFEGSSADANETTLTVTNPTADRIITFPDATGTVVLKDTTDTLTNKSISLASNTVTGTTAEFNTALSDSNFVTTGDTGSVTSTMIADGTIVNADINASAAIAQSKIDGLTTDLAAKLALAGGSMTGAIAMGTNKITGLGTPTDSTDAATKSYVDAVTEGLHIHPSVVAATTANVTLASALENGDTLDGVILATGNRILVKNQTTQSENGIYVVAASGAPSRATDFDSPAEIDGGDFVFVTGGTANDNTGWVQVNTVGTVGTDAIVFTQFSGAGTYTAGNGLTLTGTVFSANIGTDIQAYNSTLAAVAGGTYTGDDSITTLGTISAGTWNGTTIAIANGGTGATTASTAAAALLPAQASNSGKYLTTDGSGTLSWGTVTGYSAPTLGSTSIASGATVTTIAGLTLTAPTLTETVTASGDINLTAAGGPGSLIDELTLLLIGAI